MMLCVGVWIRVVLLLTIGLCVATPYAIPAVTPEVSDGKALLQQLIDGARKEGEVHWFGVSGMGDAGVKAVEQAFNRRFGFNIRLNVDLASDIVTVHSKAMMETKTGLPPTYDVLWGPDHRAVRLWEIGGVERIDSWEPLLKEISPESYALRERVSPLDLAGYAFLWATRIKSMNYNPKLISEAELPQTTIDLGNPKYKGMFPMAPFITDALFGILVYPKDRWMEIVTTWGAQRPQIMTYRSGVDRMLLGEFKFMPSNAYYVYETKAKDPKAPIDIAFFKDLTARSDAFNMVRKGAKHPNAAKLFTLWSTTPEANRLFESVEGNPAPNLILGKGPISRQIDQALKKKNQKVVSWFDNKETFKTLRWYDTPEGARYTKQLNQARVGRQ